MQIVDGKWVVDDHLTPLDERTSPSFIELGKKLEAVFGKNITHNKIKLMSQLENLSDEDIKALSVIIERDVISKLV